jgi:hypothetical protein
MNDKIHPIEQQRPVDPFYVVPVRYNFDAGGERGYWRLPYRSAHGMAVSCKTRYHGATEESGCSGDENATHGLPSSGVLAVFPAIRLQYTRLPNIMDLPA